MKITLVVLLFLLLYMLSRTVIMSQYNKRLKGVLQIMDHLDDEAVFYSTAEEVIQNCETPEYRNKAIVLKLFGDAYFSRRETFQEDLESLDIESLYRTSGKESTGDNEDSFFYLFLAVPNKLYHTGNVDLIAPLYAKIDEHAEVLDSLLVAKLGKEARKFYEGTDDLGRQFFEQFLEGEYSGYRYNKHLVGIYKNIAEAFLAKLALNEGKEIPEDSVSALRIFRQSTLGSRWLKELGIELPEEEEEKPESDDPADEVQPEMLDDEAAETDSTVVPDQKDGSKDE